MKSTTYLPIDQEQSEKTENYKLSGGAADARYLSYYEGDHFRFSGCYLVLNLTLTLLAQKKWSEIAPPAKYNRIPMNTWMPVHRMDHHADDEWIPNHSQCQEAERTFYAKLRRYSSTGSI